MILVTGGNGFVGRHVVARLAGAGEPVRAMVRNPGRYSAPDGVQVVAGDLVKPETLRAALAGVDKLVHAAAITANLKEPYRGAYRDINENGTRNLVSAAREAGVKRLVLMSGLGTRPAPPATYMSTRWGMEDAVRQGGIAYVIIQPSVQFGDGAEFVAALARLARTSPVVPALTGRHDKFQPIWVEDAVTTVARALEDDALLGRAIAIGGPDHYTFKGLYKVILEAMGKKRILAPLPVGLARLQATMMSVLPHPPLTRATLELFSFENATDLDAVEKNFGFTPQAFRPYLLEHGVES